MWQFIAGGWAFFFFNLGMLWLNGRNIARNARTQRKNEALLADLKYGRHLLELSIQATRPAPPDLQAQLQQYLSNRIADDPEPAGTRITSRLLRRPRVDGRPEQRGGDANS